MNKRYVDILKNLKRVNYFTGKLLTLDDFQTEQQYFKDRMDLHNRYLHGNGIVSGLEASLSTKSPCTLRISPGYAIDAYGNDVIAPADLQGPLPADGNSAYLVLCWAEREVDLIPFLNSGGEGEQLVASHLEEYAVLKYEFDKRKASQTGVILARLKKVRGKWKIDKQFHPHRIRA
jgi:hypothetical protein